MDEISRGNAAIPDRGRDEDGGGKPTGSRQRSRSAHNAEPKALTNDGRGRSAEKPSDIPARGWEDILWRVYEGISDDRILANAAAVTFYALLALFPALAALVSIYGLFADPASMQQHLDTVSSILPGGTVKVI
jgi:membrane protein